MAFETRLGMQRPFAFALLTPAVLLLTLSAALAGPHEATERLHRRIVSAAQILASIPEEEPAVRPEAFRIVDGWLNGAIQSWMDTASDSGDPSSFDSSCFSAAASLLELSAQQRERMTGADLASPEADPFIPDPMRSFAMRFAACETSLDLPASNVVSDLSASLQ
jgi:hypothetical protein